MQKLSTVFVFFMCTVSYAYGAAAIFPPETKPPEFACEEGCYLKSLKRVLPYEKPYYPKGKCQQYTCKTNNYTEFVSCGAIGVPEGCTVVSDLTQKYPKCCGNVVCPTTTTEDPTTEGLLCEHDNCY